MMAFRIDKLLQNLEQETRKSLAQTNANASLLLKINFIFFDFVSFGGYENKLCLRCHLDATKCAFSLRRHLPMNANFHRLAPAQQVHIFILDDKFCLPMAEMMRRNYAFMEMSLHNCVQIKLVKSVYFDTHVASLNIFSTL